MFEIEEKTILDLQNAMQRRQITSREIVLNYFSRIADIDKVEGGLHSVLELNPDALHIADELDSLRSKGTVLSPLHGIPVLLKDNISTNDKMHTSAGSIALGDNYSLCDAHIVTLLRKAGAIILGKTNMSEFAQYMSNKMPPGYSSRGGQTLNPYDKTASPSGSSTGSAVAVSANLCTVAVGTESSGSIIAPSKTNGIVGVKPTTGLASRYGIIPISSTIDTPGPMARTVTDAAILLEYMAGRDSKDIATGQSKQVFYTQYLNKNGLYRKRIGISRVSVTSGEYLNKMEAIISLIKKSGAICVELPDYSDSIQDNHSPFFKYEFKAGINNYLKSCGNQNSPRTLHEIIKYNENNAEKALKYGQNLLFEAQFETSGALTEPEYLRAVSKRGDYIKKFDRLFTDNRVDVIIIMSGNPRLPAFLGFPSMTIPIGILNNNLPDGMFMTARRFDEKSLFQVAYAIEQKLNSRKNPIH